MFFADFSDLIVYIFKLIIVKIYSTSHLKVNENQKKYVCISMIRPSMINPGTDSEGGHTPTPFCAKVFENAHKLA